eukprot:1143825-Pelagomonas_calceolata.AAC.4
MHPPFPVPSMLIMSSLCAQAARTHTERKHACSGHSLFANLEPIDKEPSWHYTLTLPVNRRCSCCKEHSLGRLGAH